MPVSKKRRRYSRVVKQKLYMWFNDLALVDEQITGILTKEIIEAQYQLSYN